MKLTDDLAHQRLDRAICTAMNRAGREVSVRQVRRALKAGEIQVDGRRAAPGHPCTGNETVSTEDFIPRSESQLAPDEQALARTQVRFEDERVLILDKPSGMPTAPLRSGELGTLLSAAIAHDRAIATAGPLLEGGLVHRLDTGTSGLVAFAKTEAVHERLRAAFSASDVTKTYTAWVFDPARLWTDNAEQTFEQRLSAKGVPVRLDPDGVIAHTQVELQKRRGDFCCLTVRPRTGRRHQIRAHLAGFGTPIAADAQYGGPDVPTLGRSKHGGFALHAQTLQLPLSPLVEALAPWTDDLAQWWANA